MSKLFILLVLFFAAEVCLFSILGAYISTTTCLLLTLASVVVGIILFRFLGFKLLAEAQKKIAGGSPATSTIINGLGVLVAGVFLILPGFLSDVIGLMCLIPKARTLFVRGLVSRLTKTQKVNPFGCLWSTYSDTDSGPIIDAVYSEINRDTEQNGDLVSAFDRDNRHG